MKPSRHKTHKGTKRLYDVIPEWKAQDKAAELQKYIDKIEKDYASGFANPDRMLSEEAKAYTKLKIEVGKAAALDNRLEKYLDVSPAEASFLSERAPQIIKDKDDLTRLSAVKLLGGVEMPIWEAKDLLEEMKDIPSSEIPMRLSKHIMLASKEIIAAEGKVWEAGAKKAENAAKDVLAQVEDRIRPRTYQEKIAAYAEAKKLHKEEVAKFKAEALAKAQPSLKDTATKVAKGVGDIGLGVGLGIKDAVQSVRGVLNFGKPKGIGIDVASGTAKIVYGIKKGEPGKVFSGLGDYGKAAVRKLVPAGGMISDAVQLGQSVAGVSSNADRVFKGGTAIADAISEYRHPNVEHLPENLMGYKAPDLERKLPALPKGTTKVDLPFENLLSVQDLEHKYHITQEMTAQEKEKLLSAQKLYDALMKGKKFADVQADTTRTKFIKTIDLEEYQFEKQKRREIQKEAPTVEAIKAQARTLPKLPKQKAVAFFPGAGTAEERSKALSESYAARLRSTQAEIDMIKEEREKRIGGSFTRFLKGVGAKPFEPGQKEELQKMEQQLADLRLQRSAQKFLYGDAPDLDIAAARGIASDIRTRLSGPVIAPTGAFLPAFIDPLGSIHPERWGKPVPEEKAQAALAKFMKEGFHEGWSAEEYKHLRAGARRELRTVEAFFRESASKKSAEERMKMAASRYLSDITDVGREVITRQKASGKPLTAEGAQQMREVMLSSFARVTHRLAQSRAREVAPTEEIARQDPSVAEDIIGGEVDKIIKANYTRTRAGDLLPKEEYKAIEDIPDRAPLKGTYALEYGDWGKEKPQPAAEEGIPAEDIKALQDAQKAITGAEQSVASAQEQESASRLALQAAEEQARAAIEAPKEPSTPPGSAFSRSGLQHAIEGLERHRAERPEDFDFSEWESPSWESISGSRSLPKIEDLPYEPETPPRSRRSSAVSLDLGRMIRDMDAPVYATVDKSKKTSNQPLAIEPAKPPFKRSPSYEDLPTLEEPAVVAPKPKFKRHPSYEPLPAIEDMPPVEPASARFTPGERTGDVAKLEHGPLAGENYKPPEKQKPVSKIVSDEYKDVVDYAVNKLYPMDIDEDPLPDDVFTPKAKPQRRPGFMESILDMRKLPGFVGDAARFMIDKVAEHETSANATRSFLSKTADLVEKLDSSMPKTTPKPPDVIISKGLGETGIRNPAYKQPDTAEPFQAPPAGEPKKSFFSRFKRAPAKGIENPNYPGFGKKNVDLPQSVAKGQGFINKAYEEPTSVEPLTLPAPTEAPKRSWFERLRRKGPTGIRNPNYEEEMEMIPTYATSPQQAAPKAAKEPPVYATVIPREKRLPKVKDLPYTPETPPVSRRGSAVSLDLTPPEQPRRESFTLTPEEAAWIAGDKPESRRSSLVLTPEEQAWIAGDKAPSRKESLVLTPEERQWLARETGREAPSKVGRLPSFRRAPAEDLGIAATQDLELSLEQIKQLRYNPKMIQGSKGEGFTYVKNKATGEVKQMTAGRASNLVHDAGEWEFATQDEISALPPEPVARPAQVAEPKKPIKWPEFKRPDIKLPKISLPKIDFGARKPKGYSDIAMGPVSPGTPPVEEPIESSFINPAYGGPRPETQYEKDKRMGHLGMLKEPEPEVQGPYKPPISAISTERKRRELAKTLGFKPSIQDLKKYSPKVEEVPLGPVPQPKAAGPKVSFPMSIDDIAMTIEEPARKGRQWSLPKFSLPSFGRSQRGSYDLIQPNAPSVLAGVSEEEMLGGTGGGRGFRYPTLPKLKMPSFGRRSAGSYEMVGMVPSPPRSPGGGHFTPPTEETSFNVRSWAQGGTGYEPGLGGASGQPLLSGSSGTPSLDMISLSTPPPEPVPAPSAMDRLRGLGERLMGLLPGRSGSYQVADTVSSVGTMPEQDVASLSSTAGSDVGFFSGIKKKFVGMQMPSMPKFGGAKPPAQPYMPLSTFGSTEMGGGIAETTFTTPQAAAPVGPAPRPVTPDVGGVPSAPKTVGGGSSTMNNAMFGLNAVGSITSAILGGISLGMMKEGMDLQKQELNKPRLPVGNEEEEALGRDPHTGRPRLTI